jgi:hypothetical protein
LQDGKAINPLHRKRGSLLGASGARRRWRSPLYLHSGLVGWHPWHPTVAVGAVGEAVGLGATTAGAPGEVGGLFGRAQQVGEGLSPTPRQQGIEAQASPASSRFGWARLLKRVFSIDMERCPRCHLGALRTIAAITYRPIIRRILRHLQLAADPPPIVPARAEQGCFAWASP